MMKNRIPPPVILLLLGVLMWFIARSEFAVRLDIPFALAIAIALAVLGLSASGTAIVQFSRASTTVNPLKPETASALVQGGIFSRSRNPMYVGLLLVLTGWGVWLQSFSNIAVLLAYVVLITELQIKPEEAALQALFGDDYSHYCKRVRRWI